MPSKYPLALIADDERLLKVLNWQLLGEDTEVVGSLLLGSKELGSKVLTRRIISDLLTAEVSAVVTCLSHLRTLQETLTLARERALPVVVCSPHPTLEEATLCVRGGASEYLHRPWQNSHPLTKSIVLSIESRPHQSDISQAPPTLDERPSLEHTSSPKALSELIDFSLGFQEALTPIEDELRRIYLNEVLCRAGSVNGAARLAGVDRSNFKRLLKRYHVTRGGEPS